MTTADFFNDSQFVIYRRKKIILKFFETLTFRNDLQTAKHVGTRGFVKKSQQSSSFQWQFRFQLNSKCFQNLLPERNWLWNEVESETPSPLWRSTISVFCLLFLIQNIPTPRYIKNLCSTKDFETIRIHTSDWWLLALWNRLAEVHFVFHRYIDHGTVNFITSQVAVPATF